MASTRKRTKKAAKKRAKKVAKKKSKTVAKKEIGFLHSGSLSNSDHAKPFKVLTDGLDFVGYGRVKVHFTKVFAEDLPDELGKKADKLVAAGVEVLVAAGGSASVFAAQKATAATKTPVVFTSFGEPTSPAPHMTGVCASTSKLDPERLKKLHALLPGEKDFGVLVNKLRHNLPAVKSSLDTEAGLLNLHALDYKEVDPLGDVDKQIDEAFKFWAAPKNGYKAALVSADPLFNNHRSTVLAVAQNYSFPAIYQWREFVDAGGLMSYGPSLTLAYKLAGIYVGHILDKKQPVDLPVLPIDSFDLVINLSTASEIGIDIPYTLLAEADDIVL